VKKRGGGVLLYVKKSILGLQKESAEECEALCVKLLGGGNMNIYVAVCYRSPSATKAKNELLYSEKKIFASKSSVVVMGDFHFGEID